MPEQGQSARHRTCNCCDKRHAVTADQLNSPLGQVMFYEGFCLECATRSVVRVAHEQVEMRADAAMFRAMSRRHEMAGVA